MYHLCLLEPALFRFLHDAPRSELPIDLPRIFFMSLRGHLVLEVEYYKRTKRQGSGDYGGACAWMEVFRSPVSLCYQPKHKTIQKINLLKVKVCVI